MSTEKLFSDLEAIAEDSAAAAAPVREAIAAALAATWDDWGPLKTALKALDVSTEYGSDEYGDVYRWARFYEASKMPKREREYFKAYLSDRDCVGVDFENDALMSYCGPCLIVKDGRDRDAGVYDTDSHKGPVIDADSCKILGDWDDDKAAAEIEAYMEKTGCFSDVLRADYHGGLAPFGDTQAMAKRYRASVVHCAHCSATVDSAEEKDRGRLIAGGTDWLCVDCVDDETDAAESNK